MLLTPRDPPHALDGGPPTDRHRGDHRVGPEHPLHPGERAPGPVTGRGVAAPEAELAPGGRHHHVGREAQQGQATGDDVVAGRARFPVTLPGSASAVSHASSCQRTRVAKRGGRERAFVAPAPGEPLAVLGLGFHHHLAARHPQLVESREEAVGEHLRRERGFVDAGRGRIELDGLHELGRHRRGDEIVLRRATCETVRTRAGHTEAREHRGVGKCGEVGEGAQAESRAAGRRAQGRRRRATRAP